jgi:hypothetical protein
MLLRWLISAVGLATLKGEVSQAVGRATRRALLAAVIGILWLIAIGFAIAALAVWLSHVLGTAAACAIIAGGLAVIGLALQLVLALGGKRKPPPAATPFSAAGTATDATEGTPFEGQNLTSIALIGVIGYLIGRQIFRK